MASTWAQLCRPASNNYIQQQIDTSPAQNNLNFKNKDCFNFLHVLTKLGTKLFLLVYFIWLF